MVNDSNTIILAGKVTKEPEYIYTSYDEKFYSFEISSERLSKVSDTLIVNVSERLLNEELKVGTYVKLEGQIRTYNKEINGKLRLLIFVFTKNLEVISKEEIKEIKNPNQVVLEGYICTEPKYRTTPQNREITDLIIAVNRKYGKSDYIPVIVWGRNAKYTANFPVSSHVRIEGRLQSRVYIKKYSDDVQEERIAYEVSVNRIGVVDEDSNLEDTGSC